LECNDSNFNNNRPFKIFDKKEFKEAQYKAILIDERIKLKNEIDVLKRASFHTKNFKTCPTETPLKDSAAAFDLQQVPEESLRSSEEIPS
jgi:hypothetical protein